MKTYKGFTAPGYDQLAAAIVVQAVEDFRLEISKWCPDTAYVVNTRLAPIRSFFRSDWCLLLMTGMALEPELIIDQLERELDAQREKYRGEVGTR